MVAHKKIHRPPPEKYNYEKTVKDLPDGKIIANVEIDYGISDRLSSSPPLYPITWGWNGARQLGNATAVELRIPSQVQKSYKHNFVSGAAGKLHTIIVSDEGNNYSFGDNRYAQMGRGHIFDENVMGDKGLRAYPKETNPSGEKKIGRDLQIIEVSSGSKFIVARELNIEEGIKLCIGLPELQIALRKLLLTFSDTVTIQTAWANVRQERFNVSKVASGTVVVWGSGKRGQLGLGKYIQRSTYPFVIPRLRDVSIIQVTAGENHVLAIDSSARVYSWGSGRCGKLGHGDFENRYKPDLIKYFDLYYAEQCSAGDNHSAVLITSRKGNRAQQLRKIVTFGRGAHGRLGNGKNRNCHTPAAVLEWLPSLRGLQIKQVSCGGAHTLALMVKKVNKSLANPWAVETYIAAWGFGMNGQLGSGYYHDSFIPLKCKIPRWEKIAEVCAGRSWSMARTIAGDLYTWGKGLRGQLGQGSRKFCLAPCKVETFAALLKLDAGYGHNACIATLKKYLNVKESEKSVGKEDPLQAVVDRSLQKYICKSAYTFSCCRTNLSSSKVNIRVDCLDCSIKCICYLCAKICHHKHRLMTSNMKAVVASIGTENSLFHHCRCGVFNDKCRILPTIEDTPEENELKDAHRNKLLHDISKRENSAVIIQRLGKRYIGRKQLFKMKKHAEEVRREACENYWNKVVLANIWTKFDRAYAMYREHREKLQMRIEDINKKRYDYFCNLQKAIQGMDATMFGARAHLRFSCPFIPIGNEYDEGNENGKFSDTGSTISVDRDVRPTYSLSWSSLRAQQLNTHPLERASVDKIAKISQFLPRYDRYEGTYFDKDVHLILSRYVKDDRTERWRKARELAIKEAIERKIVQAKEAQLAKLRSQGRKVPPPPPPLSPEELQRLRRYQKIQAAKLAAEIAERERDEDKVFLAFKPKKKDFIKRRKSIADPDKMFSRIAGMREHVTLRGFALRRNSLPIDIKKLLPVEKPTFAYISLIKKSLDLYVLRNSIMDELTSTAFAARYEAWPKDMKKKKLKKALSFAMLNPRLPTEMLSMILHGERRRTIAEPERLERQLSALFDIRNNLSILRRRSRAENMPIRRRSFDFGEDNDQSVGVYDILNYEFDEKYALPTKGEIAKDRIRLDKAILANGLTLSEFERSEKDEADLAPFAEMLAKEKKKPVASEAKAPVVRGTARGNNSKSWTGAKKKNAAQVEFVQWQEHFSDEGYTYYFRQDTGVSSWEIPVGPEVQILTQYQNEEGMWYWYNNSNGEVIWF